MNTEEILTLYDDQERKNSTHPSYRREEAGPVVRHVSKDPSRLSFIIYTDLNEDNADKAIREQIDWYQTEVSGYGFEWKTYDHDRPADLKTRLLAQGFAGDEAEALLVIDLLDCPEVYLQPVTTDVRQISDGAQIADVAAIQEQVYGRSFDWLERQLQENIAQEPDFWSIYIAYVDGVAACAAWTSFPSGSSFAGLWGGATLSQYRRRGLYTAVVAARAQEALDRGYRFLMVDAGEMSRPILEKRGFKLLTHTTPFTWTSERGN
ncbi:MAG: GNAT family N-acetyltransferase [Candidatus Promineifilaceae bacterium]|nr:GNAT family N-acetyltransferase [Candidatus Promineifilaceae bacterium]